MDKWKLLPAGAGTSAAKLSEAVLTAVPRILKNTVASS